MTPPTVDDFLTRYPEFEDSDEDQIQFCINDAARSVDDTWLVGDQQPAVMALAAHLLSAGNAQSATSSDTGPAITSETIGRISVSYGKAASASDLTTTEYGNVFQLYFLRNRQFAIVI